MDQSLRDALLILCIVGSLSVGGLFLDQQNTASTPTGAAAYFSEPTFCTYDSGNDISSIECACGRATFSVSGSGAQATRLRDMQGRSLEVDGNYCLLRQQRDICSEMCRNNPSYILRRGYLTGIYGVAGTVDIVSVDGTPTPSYSEDAAKYYPYGYSPYYTYPYDSAYYTSYGFSTNYRPTYYPGHYQRATSGAYAYIDDYRRY